MAIHSLERQYRERRSNTGARQQREEAMDTEPLVFVGVPSGWRQAARLESARVRDEIFHAVCMMESAICAALAKRERRREAGTIWL